MSIYVQISCLFPVNIFCLVCFLWDVAGGVIVILVMLYILKQRVNCCDVPYYTAYLVNLTVDRKLINFPIIILGILRSLLYCTLIKLKNDNVSFPYCILYCSLKHLLKVISIHNVDMLWYVLLKLLIIRYKCSAPPDVNVIMLCLTITLYITETDINDLIPRALNRVFISSEIQSWAIISAHLVLVQVSNDRTKIVPFLNEWLLCSLHNK